MLKCFPFKADQTKNNNKYKMLENVKMKYFLITLLILSLGLNFFVFTYNRGAVADDLRFDEQEATVRAINSVMPAVVSITVYDWDYFEALDAPTGQKEMLKYKKQKIKGTGFLISSDGYIVTNRHVVSVVDEKSGEFRVILNSGKQYYAQLIAKDAFNDIAILKVSGAEGIEPLSLGDSSKLEVGQEVIAIGNPLGDLSGTVTKGIISALGRNVQVNQGDFFNSRLENFEGVIQTDAAINPGNSGGPLIDMNGRVIGINFATVNGAENLSFALPIDRVQSRLNELEQYGEFRIPYIGVQYIDKIVFVSNKSVVAVQVINVVPTSPAAKAGIKVGDFIIGFDGEDFSDKSFVDKVQDSKIGEKVKLEILRDDKQITVEVVVGQK